MSTVHLETMGMINNFKFMEGEPKQKAVWSVVIRISEQTTKKGTDRNWLIPLVSHW